MDLSIKNGGSFHSFLYVYQRAKWIISEYLRFRKPPKRPAPGAQDPQDPKRPPGHVAIAHRRDGRHGPPERSLKTMAVRRPGR